MVCGHHILWQVTRRFERRLALFLLCVSLYPYKLSGESLKDVPAGIAKFLFFLFLVNLPDLLCYGHIDRQKSSIRQSRDLKGIVLKRARKGTGAPKYAVRAD